MNTPFFAAVYAVLWARHLNITSVATRDVRLKMRRVLFAPSGNGNEFEERIAEAGKPCEDSTADTLDQVGYEVKGDPSSRIIPDIMGILNLGAVGPRGRVAFVKNMPSTTGYLKVY